MHRFDYYAILGVMPNAEDVVIYAAYRALAQRYHPDKWDGDPEEAHQKMVKINEAYSVLKDPVQRSEYDKSRSADRYADFSNGDFNDQNEAFNNALSEVEEKWNLACLVFPDLHEHRQMLSRTSTALAFAFVMVMIETKNFNSREEIARNMENTFLQRYFGSNNEIVKFAKNLIRYGYRDAAKKLNKIVDVVGDAVDPVLIISAIQKEFDVYSFDGDDIYTKKYKQDINKLKNDFKREKLYEQAVELAKLLGYHLVEDSNTGTIKINTPYGQTLRFDKKAIFVAWVSNNLCMD